MTTKKIIKFVVPFLMIVIIAIIWISQNQSIFSEKGMLSMNDYEYILRATNIDLELLKENNLPIIINFSADNCTPCKKIEPILEMLHKEMQGKVIIHSIDVWENQEFTREFPIQVTPTQVIINSDGTPYIPSNDISKMLKFSMYNSKDGKDHTITTHQGALSENQLRSIMSDMGVE